MKKMLNEILLRICKHKGQIRRKLRTALVMVLCFSITYTATGCNNILGDGEITIVTAPPMVTPQVVVTDNYGEGDPDRFDVGGTDAFYLLPGIENNPDFLQDFICLDYTDEGYFLYYYCAPAYISKEDVEKYKFSSEDVIARKTKKRPDEPYEAVDRSAESPCDAMILMAYNPSTKDYIVIDAQAYDKTTANSETGGEANTGIEFYKSPNYKFYMLSHCYGSRIANTKQYFIADQRGFASVYNSSFKKISYIDIGATLDYKVKELETEIKNRAKNGQQISDLVSDLDDGDEESKKDKDEALEDLKNATGHSYDTGGGDVSKLDLKYLIKSIVTDSTGVVYASLMIYTGESPWSSDVLFNRVVCLTSFDLNSDFGTIISVNENHSRQVELYKEYYKSISMDKIKSGDVTFMDLLGKKVTVKCPDKMTPFYSAKKGKGLFVTGFGDRLHLSFFGWIGCLFWRDYLYGLMSYVLKLVGDRLKSYSGAQRLYILQDYYKDVGILPRMYEYNTGRKLNRSDFPSATSKWYMQNLFFTSINMDDDYYGKVAYKAPRLYPILNRTSGKEINHNISASKTYTYDPVYFKPYKYNEEIVIYDGYDISYIQNTEVANTVVSMLVQYILADLKDVKPTLATLQDELPDRLQEASETAGNVGLESQKEEQVITEQDIYQVLNSYASSLAREQYISGILNAYITVNISPYKDGRATPAFITNMLNEGFTEKDIHNALYGYVVKKTPKKSDTYSIPAGTYPISYQLVFPAGSYIESADMDNTEGSSTTSIDKGALLFYDVAKNNNGVMEYTSGIKLELEGGNVFNDSNVPGAAIDTGSLPYTYEGTKTPVNFFILITESGVKFYVPNVKVDGQEVTSVRWSGDKNYSVYIENEKLLSSTGFTPYTESGTQAAVNKRISGEVDGDEKYKDDINASATQKDMTVSLNSSRVGTLQSSSSFTAVNNDQLLITAYDSGLSLMTFKVMGKKSPWQISNVESQTPMEFEVINLRSGSYYQSFLDKKTEDYKILGFDTEDFLYGSMDLARAKVYDFSFNKSKNDILEKAMKNELDQKAVDYVRRLHRTRVDIGEDKDGNIISQMTVILPFTDDHSDEAEDERQLFEGDESAAKTRLTKLTNAKGLSSSDSSWEYLKTLRERVNNQQKALNEVFELTKANKLGDISKDPYWEGLKERLQYTTEIGDLKDILAEIVTEDKMIQKFAPNDVQTYKDFRKTLNYRQEEKEQNQSLEKVGLTATELDEMLENKKTAEDYEEQYSSVTRGQDNEIDPLDQAMNTEGIMNDNAKSTAPDRMQIRALIIEDIENAYFEIHPLEPEKVYAPDGTYTEMVLAESEDEVWENYLADLLSRINPDNLSAQRETAMNEFGELTYTTARTYENGKITDNPLTVNDDVKKKMLKAVSSGLKDCETIADVEALFFGTQVKNLGNPYGSYRDAFITWEEKEYKSVSEKAKAMRSSEWYTKLKSYLLSDKQFAATLEARNQSWEEYIQSIFSNQSGNVLRDDQTGEAPGGYTTAAGTFAQLVEFMCEGAGNVSKETKIAMVEDLLIGLETISGYESVEEAVMIERMTLPAYKKYMSDYEAFNKRTFDTTEESKDKSATKPVAVEMSSEASLRRKELLEQDFYKKVIGSMQESSLVKSYLEDNEKDWEHYIAGLATLAADSNIEDPAASARKVYEDFEPYKPIDKSLTPDASDGTEDRPTAYGD